MPRLARALGATGALKILNDELHRLHADADWPALRLMATHCHLSRTTVYRIFTEPELPKQKYILSLVEYLSKQVYGGDPIGDVAYFRGLWRAALDDDIPPPQPPPIIFPEDGDDLSGGALPGPFRPRPIGPCPSSGAARALCDADDPEISSAAQAFLGGVISPDGPRSRAILIGVGAYRTMPEGTDPIDLSPLSRLYRVLTATEPGESGLRGTLLLDPPRDAVWRAVSGAAVEAEDTLLVYFAGHGMLDRSGGGTYLSAADSVNHDGVVENVIDLDSLRFLVAGSRARNRVVILDCCYSGEAVLADITVTDGDTRLNAVAAARGGGPALAGRRNTFVMQSPYEYSQRGGVFTAALVRALEFGGRSATLDWLAAAVAAEAREAGWAGPRWATIGYGGGIALLAGPARREMPVADPVQPTLADLMARVDRTTLYNEAASWLTHAHSPVLLVGGSPGSGKTRLLKHLAALGGVDDSPWSTAFVDAGAGGRDGLLGALGRACGAPSSPSVADLTAALAGLSTPTLVLIDALDELGDGRQGGDTPWRVARQLLPSLFHESRDLPVRWVVSARRPVIAAIDFGTSGSTVMLDLDDERFADRDAFRRGVFRALTLSARSPYRGRPRGWAAEVAEVIMATADRSYFLARTLSDWAVNAAVAGPVDPNWRRALRRLAGLALRAEIDRRLGPVAGRALDLMLPLAYAPDGVLPRDRIWPTLASALAGRAYDSHDVDWLVDRVGGYVESDVADGRWRLFHACLSEALTDGRDRTADQRAIVDALLAQVPRVADGRRDWTGAHRYIRRFLAAHAAWCGALDDLAVDPGFLLAAEQAELVTALPAVATHDAVVAAAAYRRALPGLVGNTLARRVGNLLLAAEGVRAYRLVQAIEDGEASAAWRPRWTVRLAKRHAALSTFGPGAGIATGAIAVGRIADRWVVGRGVVDHTVRLWDAATGRAVGRPLTGHTFRVSALAFGVVGGRDLVASAGDEGRIRIWDLWTGRAVGRPMTGHTRRVSALAFGVVDGRDVVVSAGLDGTVRLWDPQSGHCLQGAATVAHRRGSAVAVGRVGSRMAVLGGDRGHSVRVWDLATGEVIGAPLTGHQRRVSALAWTEAAGRVLVAAGGADGAVRVWDLGSGRPLLDAPAAHTEMVSAVEVAEFDGRLRVLSAAPDGTVRLWADVNVGAEPAMMKMAAPVAAVRCIGAQDLVVGTLDGLLGVRIEE